MKTSLILLSCLAIAFSAIPKDRFNICAIIDCNATKPPPTTKATFPTTPSPTESGPVSGNFGLLKAQLVSLLNFDLMLLLS